MQHKTKNTNHHLRWQALNQTKPTKKTKYKPLPLQKFKHGFHLLK